VYSISVFNVAWRTDSERRQRAGRDIDISICMCTCAAVCVFVIKLFYLHVQDAVRLRG